VNEVTIGPESGFEENHKIFFDVPRTVDYRANVTDIKESLIRLMNSSDLRQQLGNAGRERVIKHFDYRNVAAKFIKIASERLNIT